MYEEPESPVLPVVDIAPVHLLGERVAARVVDPVEELPLRLAHLALIVVQQSNKGLGGNLGR